MRAASRWIAIVGVASAQGIFLAFGCSDSSTGAPCGTGDDGPHDAPNADAPGDGNGDGPSDGSGDGMKAEAAIDASSDAADSAAGDGAAAATDAGDSGDALGNAEAATTNVSAVRVANWSPDSPSVDFCLAPHASGAFQGPLVARLANPGGAEGGAAAAALAFPQVSAYSYVAPGRYDARLVVAGSADCTSGIAADATTLPALAAGAFETIALVGEAHAAGSDPGLELVGFLDDQHPSGMVALRFINAAPAIPKVDMGTGPAASFKPLFLGVSFGQTTIADAGATSVDSNGYLTMQPLAAVTLSAHPPGATMDSATASNVSAAAGSILTIVLLGRTPGASADAGPPGQFVECVDNAGTVGPYENCSALSP